MHLIILNKLMPLIQYFGSRESISFFYVDQKRASLIIYNQIN